MRSVNLQNTELSVAFQIASSNFQKSCTSTFTYTEHLLNVRSSFYPDQSHVHNKKKLGYNGAAMYIHAYKLNFEYN